MEDYYRDQGTTPPVIVRPKRKKGKYSKSLRKLITRNKQAGSPHALLPRYWTGKPTMFRVRSVG
jgi:hypothetical protein